MNKLKVKMKVKVKGMNKWCFSPVLAILLFLVAESVLAGCPPGLLLQVAPLQAVGAVGGGTSFNVRIGTTVGPAILSVETDQGLRSFLDQARFKGGGETTLVLVPRRAALGQILTATVTARAGTTTVTRKVKLAILNDESVNTLRPTGIKWRDAALEYLQQRHPGFAASNGLDNEVRWKGYAPYPLPMIVSHYTFRWRDWHIRVLWHVTTPPDDWKRVFLSNEKQSKYWAVEFDTHNIPREIPYH